MKKKALNKLLGITLEIIERLQDQLECEIESTKQWKEDYDISITRRLREKEEWEAAREIDKRLDENVN
jgi:hypothetical protein